MKSYLVIFIILLAAAGLMAQTPKISDLIVSGVNIKWYDPWGMQFTDPANTALVNGQIYYASQTINGVESADRIAVTAWLNSRPNPAFNSVVPTAKPGANVIYTTQSGMSGYIWTYPGILDVDYTITSGGAITDNSVTLKYITLGSKIVTINYTENGCTAASATSSTATMVNVAFGDSFGGGKVFYVFVYGQSGYVAGETHGLIVALADQNAGIEWITGGSTQTTWNGNTLTAIGTGQANTNFMIAQTGFTGGAAKLCNDYTNTNAGTGIYSDWYLPSSDELDFLCDNKSSLGGFTSDAYYWSSSENISSEGKRVTFNGFCYPGWNSKATLYRVRAIRSF